MLIYDTYKVVCGACKREYQIKVLAHASWYPEDARKNYIQQLKQENKCPYCGKEYGNGDYNVVEYYSGVSGNLTDRYLYEVKDYDE